MITARHITDAWHGISDADAKELVRKLRGAEGDPDEVDAALEAANEALGGYGIEALPCEQGCQVDKYYMNTIALYINMGDTYSATIVYDTVEEEFFVGAWGDFLEAHEAEEHGDEEEEEEEDDGAQPDDEDDEEGEADEEEEEEPALR